MSYRQSNPSFKDACLIPQSRLNQQIRCDSTDEGCPVIEESGTVCGETNSLSIFQEFRQMYDDCLKKLEGTVNGNATLKKLAPFKKLIDDLWEQNTMLVETVEELEQEATYRVTNLQDRLNKSCQKISDYKDDIKCLVKIIHSFCENGIFDPTGLKFKTFCCTSVFGDCSNRSCGKGGRGSETTCKNVSCSSRDPSQNNYSVPKEKGRYDFCDSNAPSRTFSSKRTFSGKLKSENSAKFPSATGAAVSICEASFPNVSTRSFDEMCTFDTDSMAESNCPEYTPPVNVNFKLENDDTLDCQECCCGCSCMYPEQ